MLDIGLYWYILSDFVRYYTDNYKFTTRMKLKNENIEVINSTRLLGTILTDDLRWELNISNIVKKANGRMQLLQKVASFGTPIEDLKTPGLYKAEVSEESKS